MKNEVTKTTPEQDMYVRARGYYSLGCDIHVTLKNGRWLNGKITALTHESFWLDEFKEGSHPVLFIDVADIRYYTPKQEDKEELKHALKELGK